MMKIINGVFASAKVFTTNNIKNAIDDYAVAQLQMLCDNEAVKGCRVRVMPDVHPGKVGTIGLTMTVGQRILPNVVGIDIGCGLTIAKLKVKKIEFQKLDTVIRENVPSGFNVRKKPHRFSENIDFSELRCAKSIRLQKAALSLGTLGGGNHFIEVNRSDDGILLGTGKGNSDWNYSAPHGAGRIMKREDVRSNFTVSAFKSEMKGIYSSCISKDTLDEAPFAYRNLDDIAGAISDTVKIQQIIRPVYNYKAGGND